MLFSSLHRLRPLRSVFLACALSAFAGFNAGHATDADALLTALVRKGLLTEKDAAQVQQESAASDQQTSTNKIKLSNSLTELRLYGDVRLRFQYDNVDNQIDPRYFYYYPNKGTFGFRTRGGGPSGNQEDHFSLRLRLNADFKLTDNWFGGVQLQTGYQSDSADQTLTGGFSNYGIYISKAYLGYAPAEWLTLTGGKVPNPFYTTELVWDNDINPTGFAEQVSFHKLFGRGAEAGSYDKDGKGLAGTAQASPWELTLVAGQFIFEDNHEGGGRDPGSTDHDTNTDAWLFETQLIGSWRFSPAVKGTSRRRGWFTPPGQSTAIITPLALPIHHSVPVPRAI